MQRKFVLMEKVNPSDLKISDVEHRKNGVLVIQADNIDDRNKIKST